MQDAAAPSSSRSEARTAGSNVIPAPALPPKKIGVPILDPRVKHGLDQLAAVLDEFDIAIAWADKAGFGDHNPVIFGRNLRRARELMAAGIENVTPAPSSSLPALIEETREDMRQSTARRKTENLELAVPPQSRPAFANKAGAR